MVLFHSFCNWVVFRCIYGAILVYPFICQWTLKLLLYLGYCNRGAMNILVHVPSWIWLLDHMMILFLVFWGTSIPFSIVASLICIPTNSVGGLPFLHTLSSIYCSTPHCSFDFYFSNNHQCWPSFHVFIGQSVCLPCRNVCLGPSFDWASCFSDTELYELLIYIGR